MNNSKRFKLIELFSGIGSQAKALKKLGIDFDVINTCEWNYHAMMAYSLIHDVKKESFPVEKTREELIQLLLDLGISNDGKKPINHTGLM